MNNEIQYYKHFIVLIAFIDLKSFENESYQVYKRRDAVSSDGIDIRVIATGG